MKTSFYILSFICTSILISCTKDYEYYKSDPSNRHSASIRTSDRTSINKTDILGTWINTINSDDTIIIFEGKMARWERISKSFFHFYDYTLKGDSIIIDYTGLYKVGTPQYRREIYLNNSLDLLSIRNFHTVYPGYIGDKFRKLNQ
jgi:hypothetical protein